MVGSAHVSKIIGVRTSRATLMPYRRQDIYLHFGNASRSVGRLVDYSTFRSRCDSYDPTGTNR
ncbi:hypothetical protein M408DRAFT_328644 [Serendipita vermifera MAFF 305830]|uniref:Uncharacterized protein n=1 Tax=Serendipita vermifera MAFF 305830 TaxID=933852 RepID=A0A0C3AZA7_SERVB|nr:hypothetical protein M408DRAFT_328644 [Serendipita vermifera MAFF 305830]